MARSIRISDEFYDIALHAGEAMGRSLAQQMEHWARLGAALDAAGVNFEQTVQLLQGSTAVRGRVLEALGIAPSVLGVAAKAARSRHEREAAVACGERSPSSLFLLSPQVVRSAKLVFAPQDAAGADGW